MAKIRLSLIAMTATFSIVSAAYAAGHLTEDQQRAMNARQAHMGLYSFNLATLGAMVQNNAPYDAAAASAAAANLAALGSIDQTSYWVEGTDSSVEGSRAKSEIWTDAAGFAAQKEGFAAAATALAAVAGDGLPVMQAAFGPVGQSCGSCHEAYRVPRN